MPTFTHGKVARFWLNDSGGTEREITNVLTQVTIPKTSDTADVSALSDSAHAVIAGLKDSTVALEGTRDATVEGYIDGVVGSLTTYAYCPEGSASGKVKYSGTVLINSYQPSSSIGDATKFSAAGQGSGPQTRATL